MKTERRGQIDECEKCRRQIVPVIETKDNCYELPVLLNFPTRSIGSSDKACLLGWKAGMRGLRDNGVCFCDADSLLQELNQLIAEQTPLMRFLSGFIQGSHEPVVCRRSVQDPERRITVRGTAMRANPKALGGPSLANVHLWFFRVPSVEERDQYDTLAEAEMLTEGEADALIDWLSQRNPVIAVGLTKEYQESVLLPDCDRPGLPPWTWQDYDEYWNTRLLGGTSCNHLPFVAGVVAGDGWVEAETDEVKQLWAGYVSVPPPSAHMVIMVDEAVGRSITRTNKGGTLQ